MVNKLQVPKVQRRRIRALIRRHSEWVIMVEEMGKEPPTLEVWLKERDIIGRALQYALDPETVKQAERGE